MVKSARGYEDTVAPGLRADYAQFTDPSYTAEANALLAGMAARAAALGDASLLHVPELRRNFSYVDLFSINACGEIAVDLASRRGGLMTAGTLPIGMTGSRHGRRQAARASRSAPS